VCSSDLIDGERSGLWKFFHKAIDEIRPRFAIVENVFALRNRGLDRVLSDLASIGYDATWTLFDSQYFGVPQRRRRMYILAVRDGIPPETDVFECDKRSGLETARRVNADKKLRKRDFEARNAIGEGITFFTRQRSDEFAQTGLSSTLAKRDYKSYTDLVVHNGVVVRRVMPHERLRLQGYPDTFFDGLDLPLMQKFRMNGMTVNVVKYIGERIHETFQI
jgi:site-specific DNA-cytosine methylase